MLNNKEKYDVIVLDIYSAIHSIPTNFVTAEFFAMIKKYLAPNGIMVANIVTSPMFNNKFSQRVDNTIRYVFKNNLTRQIINDFNPYEDKLGNIIYIYRNTGNDNEIFTADKNPAMYGQY